MILERQITIRIGFSDDDKLTNDTADKVFSVVFAEIEKAIDEDVFSLEAIAKAVAGDEAIIDFVVVPNNK